MTSQKNHTTMWINIGGSIMRARGISIVFVLVSFGVAACTDRAKPDYARCLQLDAIGDAGAAIAACSAAVAADPNSTSGTAAGTKLADLKTKEAARRDAEAQAAAERQRLLSSTDPSDWRTLVAKFPGTTEANAVLGKLATAASICPNLRTWTLATTLNCGGRKATAANAADCAGSLANVQDTVANGATSGLPADTEAQVMSTLADSAVDQTVQALTTKRAAIAAHPARAGEDTIKQGVLADYDAVIAMYTKWGKWMRHYTGSFSGLDVLGDSNEALIAKVGKNEQDRTDACSKLPPFSPTEPAQTEAPPAAGAAAPASPPPKPQATGRVVHTSCPSGQQAYLHPFRAGPTECFCGDPNNPQSTPTPSSDPSGRCVVYAAKGSDCLWKCP